MTSPTTIRTAITFSPSAGFTACGARAPVPTRTTPTSSPSSSPIPRTTTRARRGNKAAPPDDPRKKCTPGGAFFRCAGKLSEILALAAEHHAAAQQGRHGHAGVQGDARIGGLGGFHRAAGAAGRSAAAAAAATGGRYSIADGVGGELLGIHIDQVIRRIQIVGAICCRTAYRSGAELSKGRSAAASVAAALLMLRKLFRILSVC